MTLDEIENQHYKVAQNDILFSEIQRVYAASPKGSISRARSSFLMAAYYENNNLDASKKHFDETYKIAVACQNNKVLADALHGKAVIAFRTRNLRKVDNLETEALKLAIQTGHSYREAFSNYVLAIVAMSYRANESCVDYMSRSLEIAQKEGYNFLQINLFGQLAELHLISQDYSKARNYAERAVATAQKISIDTLAPKIRLATIDLELKKYGEVTKLVAEVRKTLPKENRSLWCVTHTITGKVHEAKHRYDNAEEEFRAALALADYANAERVRSNIHYHLAELFLKMKKLKPALKEALAALADAEKAQEAYVHKEALRCVHDAYKALGKYKEAHEYLEKYNSLAQENDAALLKSRLEYHDLKTDFEKEKLVSGEKTRQSELLRISLEQKELELTEKTRHLIKQTEDIAQFRDDLRALIRRSPADDPHVSEIRERLKSFPESELNWAEFDKQFKEVHPEFLRNLARRFPKLTVMEKKICALLRLNLTSSDMARLLFLSERNIENHRYRIRIKLSLDTGESLHEYLGKI